MQKDRQRRAFFEPHATSTQKSLSLAYALWLCFGIIGLHRFYLERPGTATLQILLLISGLVIDLNPIRIVLFSVLLVWVIRDAFWISKVVHMDTYANDR